MKKTTLLLLSFLAGCAVAVEPCPPPDLGPPACEQRGLISGALCGSEGRPGGDPRDNRCFQVFTASGVQALPCVATGAPDAGETFILVTDCDLCAEWRGKF